MITIIPELLESDQLQEIVGQLEGASFVDGRVSAGEDARQVKSNEEIASSDPIQSRLNEMIVRPLYQHPTFQAAVMPLKVATATIARYTSGMGYGQHMDDAIMGPRGGQYRPDVSVTVFLSAPESYQGGELVIHTDVGEQSFKLPAGQVLCYPSGSLHAVAEVTAGERLVAVTWVQSLIREPRHRAVLYDMYIVKETLRGINPGAQATACANRAYVNLTRQWSEL